METKAAAEKQVTFRLLGGGREPITGRVRNMDATLGSIVARAASKLGLAGAVEALDRNGEVLPSDTRLADLPDQEITLASDLTPAV